MKYRNASVLALLISAGLISAKAAVAQTADQGINRIKETKSITIGYQESSIPFSFLDTNQKQVGYSIDLCNAVVETLGGSNKIE